MARIWNFSAGPAALPETEAAPGPGGNARTGTEPGAASWK